MSAPIQTCPSNVALSNDKMPNIVEQVSLLSPNSTIVELHDDDDTGSSKLRVVVIRLYSLITYVFIALFFLLPGVGSSTSLTTSGNEQHLSLSSLSDNAENSLVVLTFDPSQF